MTYEILYGQICTRIDVFNVDGTWERTIYVHRSEYRTWEA